MRLTKSIHFAAKFLSSVEVGSGGSSTASHQHELNGSAALRAFLGVDEFRGVESLWVALLDDTGPQQSTVRVSWYDSRQTSTHRNAEWRLYYSGTPAIEAGDLIVLLRRDSSPAPIFFAAPSGSTWCSQLKSMLGIPAGNRDWLHSVELDAVELAFLPILEELLEAAEVSPAVVEVSPADLERRAALPDELRRLVADGFPTTRELSKLARDLTLSEDLDPDGLLLRWWETEERLFKALEARALEGRLAQARPFLGVDDFMAFSLSVHNRRKSRAGHALENHVEALLEAHGVKYSRGAQTEGARRPDFVLPGIEAYRDPSFPTDSLIVLAAKTTCKDRWRQVLNEAGRVSTKNLLTLEPFISSQQLSEMHEAGVVLVAPQSVRATYDVPPGMVCLSVKEFIEQALKLQRGQQRLS